MTLDDEFRTIFEGKAPAFVKSYEETLYKKEQELERTYKKKHGKIDNEILFANAFNNYFFVMMKRMSIEFAYVDTGFETDRRKNMVAYAVSTKNDDIKEGAIIYMLKTDLLQLNDIPENTDRVIIKTGRVDAEWAKREVKYLKEILGTIKDNDKKRALGRLFYLAGYKMLDGNYIDNREKLLFSSGLIETGIEDMAFAGESNDVLINAASEAYLSYKNFFGQSKLFAYLPDIM